MKKVICCLLLLWSTTSCKKLQNLLTFEISSTENIKIPATSLVTIPIISPVDVPVNSEESFEQNNTRANLVKEVVLQNLTLTITDPATDNFNFLKSISISIGTDQNDKVEIASLDSVPLGVSTIQLKPKNIKLDKYIKASNYTLYTAARIRSSINHDLTVKADSKFKVTADPFQ